MPPPTATPKPARRVAVASVVGACEFRIGAGHWRPGDRLPSVRDGAEQWGASPLTVLRAYRRLEAQGLIESRDRSGFFVRDGAPVIDAGDLDAIRRAYLACRARVRRDASLPSVAAFRMLLRMAEADAASSPEIAFVECTRTQAQHHAGEIEARLRAPCLALTTNDLAPDALPASLRVVVTTPFHEAEVSRACEGAPLRLVGAAIECSSEFVHRIARIGRRVSVLHMRLAQGDLIAEDLRRLWPSGRPSIEVRRVHPSRIEQRLAETLGDPAAPAPGRACILSLSNWEAASDAWRASGAVLPFTYAISRHAWPRIEAATGLVGAQV